MLSEIASLLAPEMLLVVVAVTIYVAGAFVEKANPWHWVGLGGIALAAWALAVSPSSAAVTSPIATDGLAGYTRWYALGVGALLVLMSWRPSAAPGTPEYIGSLLLIVAGLMLVAVARDLVLLFVGLELVSIPTYIVLYLGRRDVESQEATAKYFFLSVLSSAILLYGFSFLYGTGGSTDLAQIQFRLKEIAATSGSFVAFSKIAMVLVFAGLGFRIAVVPFQFYAPDVFQGTSMVNAGLLSVAPKIAGLVALVRLVAVAMPGIESYAWPTAMFLSVLTMTFGNVLALWQDNVRRLLAYSSIANAGYMLIGLSSYLASDGAEPSRWDGVGALLLYLVIYAIATLGTFAALASLARDEKQIDSVDELAGLAWSGGFVRPALAWIIAIFMFSLAGIPPMAGFWGKLAIFGSSLSLGPMEESSRPWFIALAVIGVLNSAIAAAYYLRIIGVMFFRPGQHWPETTRGSGGPLLAAATCAALVLAIGVHPWPWFRGGNRASPRPSVARSHDTNPADQNWFAGSSLLGYPEGK